MTANDSPWKQTLAGQPRMGARAERRRTTSMRDVEMFTEMTGDRNPIHYDADLAAKSPFGGLIVQGGVTTGLLNAVVAEDRFNVGDGDAVEIALLGADVEAEAREGLILGIDDREVTGAERLRDGEDRRIVSRHRDGGFRLRQARPA